MAEPQQAPASMSIWISSRSARRGMTPYEIMLSESQERMLLVAEKGRGRSLPRVPQVGLDASTIGTVTDTGKLIVRNHGEVVVDIPNRELADEAPLYDRPHGVAPFRTAPMEGPRSSPARI